MKKVFSVLGIVLLFTLFITVIVDENKLKCLPGGAGQGVVNADGLARPVDKQYPKGSPFGMRDGAMHNGLDLPAPLGTPVYAFADGKVIAAQDSGVIGFGGWVVLLHSIEGVEYSTVYGHMFPGQVHVSVGQTVSAGQQIAEVGNAGKSFGAHLHFEIHKGNRLQNGWAGVEDPGPWIDAIDAGASDVEQAPRGSNHTPAPSTSTTAPKTSDTDSDGVPATVGKFNATQTLRARQIIDAGQQRGASDKVILAALSAGIVESELLMLASQAVPESMEYEHDALTPGDYDSVGLFQTRVSLHAPKYGGIEGLMKVENQTKFFYDGAALLNTESMEPGLIAADVENPAEEYRHRYAGVMDQAIELYAALENVSAGALGAIAGGNPCGPTGDYDGDGNGIVAAAREQFGMPYVWGGGDQNGPTGGLGGGEPGFDCSGLVLYAVARATGGKLVLGHNTVAQANDPRVKVVDWEDRQPGDLLYFGPDGAQGHASVYSGEKDGKPMQLEAQTFGVPIGEYPVRLNEQVHVRRVVFDTDAQSAKDDTKQEKEKEKKDAKHP